MIMTIQEAVARYGTEAQKKYCEKHNNLESKGFNALIKTLNQHYKSVEVEGRGSGRVFTLGAKREEVAVREDKRVSNGDWSSPYTKNMDIMVVSVLEQDLVPEAAQTLSKWCLDFGLITEQMYELILSKHNQELKEEHFKNLKDKKILDTGENRILDDYIYGFKLLKSQLAAALVRMEKLNIIEYYLVPKGHVADTGKSINLHENTMKKILTLQRNLMEKHNVTDWYINTYQNAKKSREYRAEWKDELAAITDENGLVLNLDYWYKTYAIILKASRKRIISYLEKYNKEAIEQFKKDEKTFLDENQYAFHVGRNNFVVDEAQKKEDKWLDTRLPAKEGDLSFGGASKQLRNRDRRGDFEYDSEYYGLYFDNLYAYRIKKLQEFYGHTFNSADQPKQIKEDDESPFAPQNIEAELIDLELPF